MKTRRLILACAVLAALSVHLAFGWGNATHVYFAKELGAKFGPINMNEMYGALMPDCFNLMLDANGMYLQNQTHNNAMPVWHAAHGFTQKSLAFGFMTHNQTWGADYTAHVKSFTFPGFADGGYAVEKGYELLPQLAPVLLEILLTAGVPADDGDGNPVAELYAYGIAPALGHDLSETAVDLLVKRNIDRAIGPRMLLAAQCRPKNAGALLAAAYAQSLADAVGIPVEQATAIIVGAEQEYQKYIVQYGMAFSLPEKQTIALLSEQTVPIAEMYIDAALQENFPGVHVTVSPEQVTTFINAAIAAVKPDYAREVSRTLCSIEKGLRENGVWSGWQCFAMESPEQNIEMQTEELSAPQEFSLAQNTPNPFNPSTMVSYQLPVASAVKLTVYDMLGREVATLVNEMKDAGSYSVRFDGAGFSSGAYIYRLEAGSFVQTKRMLLVK
jgi:hypothetical protein